MLFARWAEAGAPRFMNTDHLTEKYIAICKKWEQNGSNSLPLWGFKLKWEQSGSILVAKREQFAPTLLPFCSHFRFWIIPDKENAPQAGSNRLDVLYEAANRFRDHYYCSFLTSLPYFSTSRSSFPAALTRLSSCLSMNFCCKCINSARNLVFRVKMAIRTERNFFLIYYCLPSTF